MVTDTDIPPPPAARWLVGGGEMGECVSAIDWSRTPLGPIEDWPQSLRTTVSLALASNFPISIAWGPQRIQIYNDGYWPICGAKHPQSMGQDFKECWFSAWPAIGEAFESATAGTTAFLENQRMFLDRNGYLEETFFTFSFSPIRDETGAVVGLFHPVTEMTEQTLAERRLEVLRAVSDEAADARTVDEAARRIIDTLSLHQLDIPFAVLYSLEDDDDVARLVGCAHVEAGSPVAPNLIECVPESIAGWPRGDVLRSGEPLQVDGLEDRFGSFNQGPYPETPNHAMLLPISVAGREHPLAILVAGVSARRPFDATYRNFYIMLQEAVTNAFVNARSYEEERKRAEALAELDRAKTTFFSNVSHEFRTPLTLMLGPLEDLLEPRSGVAPAVKDQLELVHRNGLRLLRLVNTMLDFSRIEAGRVRACYQPTDLATYTADLASAFRSACERAGLDLVVDCAPLPEEVYVDREMWEKIVLNLVSNAFKFTLRGKIEVRLEAAGDHALLTVRDTGVGIPTEELPRMFERFHRIPETGGRTHEGTGIGLALVQELVKLHGGQVNVTSKRHEGSTFAVRIPFGAAHLDHRRIGTPTGLESTGTGSAAYVEEALRWLPDGAAGEAPVIESSAGEPLLAADAAAGPRPKVLLADDNADMRSYVARLLGRRFEVEAVADGAAALAAARRNPPDLVLSDVMMPKMDGFQLLAALRGSPSTADIPVVMLSARAGEESRIEGVQAGADDYVTKPFSARELIARVDTHVRLARKRQEAAEASRETLREIDRRKDAFLAILSHELRNPLAPLRTALEIGKLRQGHLPPSSLAMMDRQVQQLTRLVDDLLEVSRITQGKLELRKEPVELASVVRTAVEDLAEVVRAREHELSVRVPEQPVWLHADAVRLTQVIGNLISNAAKYTPKGGSIELEAGSADGRALVVVRNTGVGIPADKLEEIFELFGQLDLSHDRGDRGLGIGLSLAKNLVEMHGGTIEAQSEGVGLGSEFRVWLPTIPAAAQPAARGAGPVVAEPASKRRVLIVDDNRDGAQSLAQLVEILGHETRIAYDGLEAVRAAGEFRPHVVLLDIGLPKLDGYRVAREIRAASWGSEIYLAAVTGYSQVTDRELAARSGFDRHLTKPLTFEVLKKVLEETDI